jgi:hypothetical protein
VPHRKAATPTAVCPGTDRHNGCPARQLHGIPTARRALAGDRGAVTVELVLATPLLLLALLTIIQFALWSHATHVAQAAASQALAAARVQDGTPAAGHAAGQHLLDELAHGPLQNSQIDVTRIASSATISIRGEASPVIPGLHLHVHAEASGAIERFVPTVYGIANSEVPVGGNRNAGGTS